MPTLSLTTRSLVLSAGYDSGYPQLLDGYYGGRLLGSLGCISASVTGTSGMTAFRRSRQMGFRKSSSDLDCYWGPIPTEDSFSIWDKGSLKREALGTDVRADFGFL